MARQSSVFYNGTLAGTLTKTRDSFIFTYDEIYLASRRPAIALTLPKRQEPYKSKELFPFFEGLLPEGENRKLYCMSLKIDPRDSYRLLLKLAGKETIGAITVMEDV